MFSMYFEPASSAISLPAEAKVAVAAVVRRNVRRFIIGMLAFPRRPVQAAR
jgi:hypothetical protein